MVRSLFTLIVILYIISPVQAYAQTNLTVTLIIEEVYQKVNLGEKVIYLVTVMNRGTARRQDVIMDFSVIDENEKVIKSWTQLAAIETQMSLIGKLILPEGTIPGDYNLRLNLRTYQDDFALASHSFSIEGEQPSSKKNYLLYGLIALFALQSIALVYEHRRVTGLFVSKNKLKGMISTK